MQAIKAYLLRLMKRILEQAVEEIIQQLVRRLTNILFENIGGIQEFIFRIIAQAFHIWLTVVVWLFIEYVQPTLYPILERLLTVFVSFLPRRIRLKILHEVVPEVFILRETFWRLLRQLRWLVLAPIESIQVITVHLIKLLIRRITGLMLVMIRAISEFIGWVIDITITVQQHQ
jgi:hypothetical protein